MSCVTKRKERIFKFWNLPFLNFSIHHSFFSVEHTYRIRLPNIIEVRIIDLVLQKYYNDIIAVDR